MKVLQQSEVTDRTARQLRTLLEINNALIVNLTQETLLKSIATAIQGVIPFDRAVLLLYEEKSDSRWIFALDGRSRSPKFVLGFEFGRDAASYGWEAFNSRKPSLRSDLRREVRTQTEELLYKEGLQSLISAPLLLKHQSIGTLNLGSQTSGQYGEADASFLQEIANQVALAIGNVQAHTEIARLKARLEEDNAYLMDEIKDEFDFEHIIGRSASIKKVLAQVRTVAKSDSTVFITGETGTGKELVARAIHSASKRNGRPLIKVNCAAIPGGLVESELFGHEKGSFTGALTRRIGRFEQANGGTLFLDEVGELTPDLQAKLLRVLQEREFERIGGKQTIKTDIRLVAATNQDVSQAIKDGKFRSDLYYRLNVIPIHIPALRERRDDIPLLVTHFAQKHGARIGKSFHRINPSTIAVLKAYSWPGNVRELENIIERAVLLSPGRALEVHDDLPLTITIPRPAEDTLAAVERRHIRAVLQRTNGLISGPNGAAVILGLHPNTLRSRMQKLGLRFGNFGSKRDAS